jgi:glycosyltransferase involved in cell wall biosynthesis
MTPEASPIPGVVQVVDTLDAGGMEAVAVNIANALSVPRYRSFICATRRGGTLIARIRPHVGLLVLRRKLPLAPGPILRFRHWIRHQNIRVVHAHGTSLFFSALALTGLPQTRLIWHDHYGRYAFDDRPTALYRIAARSADIVVAVNQQLAAWAVHSLRLPPHLVHFIPNFVVPEGPVLESALPGHSGKRIVCVANFRPEKDHLCLLQAFASVVLRHPTAHLLLIGLQPDEAYFQAITRYVRELNLEGRVAIMGPRTDVSAILSNSDVGVLSSQSEGLPLALLEYGAAGLPAVATDVGQCSDILGNGLAGVVVPPAKPRELAAALSDLLDNPARRRALGACLKARVEEKFGQGTIMPKIEALYKGVIQGPGEA